MDHMPIRHVRADLATVVRRAASGERTVVTVAGHRVAQIGPLEAADGPVVGDLVARGLIDAPRRRTSWHAPEPVAMWAGVRLDKALRDVRG